MHGQNLPPLKTRFIVNLHSGRAARALDEIRRFAARHHAGIALTERRSHASELARQAVADGCTLVVAVGGDGTMNEVATSLIGGDATLGLVPCGSGDGLGRHLGIHGSVAHALEVLVTGKPRLIDTGVAGGRAFCAAAGLGFEAEIAQRFNQLRRRGFARYVTTSMQGYFDYQPQDYTIVHGSHRDRVTAFTVAVGNADQYGNGAYIVPGAQVDDGLLDLCALPPIRWWNGPPLALRLFRGTLDRAPSVFLRRADRFIVERAAPGLLHADGEMVEAPARVEFSVRPASLRIMAPPSGSP